MRTDDTKSNISMWLDNAGRFPLLPQETICLMAKEIQSLPEHNPRRRRLINKIVNHNLRLVPRFVKSFLSASVYVKWGGPDTVDYLQVGATGLIRAAELYDPTKGYTFSTYANHWIRSRVSRYNLKNRSIVHVSESMSRKIIYYGRNGYLKNKVTGKRCNDSVVVPKLEEAKIALSCLSLNVTSEYGMELISTIVDRSQNSNSVNSYEEIDKALTRAGVSAIGKEILVSSFIYENSCPEIADMLNVNVSKVRHEKKVALKLARACKELRDLV